MKKLVTILVAFIIICGGANAATYELWVQSPRITTGISLEQLKIYKGFDMNKIKIYPLSKLGSSYYLAAPYHEFKGGSNGKQNCFGYYMYLVRETSAGFDIVSTLPSHPYDHTGNVVVADISSRINSSYYTSRDLEIPCYIITISGVSVYGDYPEEYGYWIVTTNGRVYKYSESTQLAWPITAADSYPIIYDGILQRGADRYKSNYTTLAYKTTEGANGIRMSPYHLKNGGTTYGDTITLAVSDAIAANGYYEYRRSANGNVSAITSSTKTSKWKNGISNKFTDGRTVTASWLGMGGGLYEIWYKISNSSGTVISTGPTGYSTTYASSFDMPGLRAYTTNNTKFIVVLDNIYSDFATEYYRAIAVQEDPLGDIQDIGGSIGNKNIIPPSNAHTEPVQSNIDFDKPDLPIGFNLKDNIVTSGKLDSLLRQQVNSIRLNDIVILKKSGYISGSQNSGISLGSYSTNDVGMGSSVQFYSNGQNFQWYCYNPENLSVGTYSKVFYVGDKTLYVTVKVIQPPNNTGTTSVTF